MTTREGQNRCSFEICANANKLYGLFKSLIEKQNSVEFPYHLAKDSAAIKKFSHVEKAEQHIIDMRPEEDKMLIMHHR